MHVATSCANVNVDKPTQMWLAPGSGIGYPWLSRVHHCPF